ncbi:ABC transporter ATP-binding protein [Streptomyces sp. MBT55]|uniref:ABC transporter ATP-binding protein n=1 Tax=Streptomyces sp. MBT55 TaxID=1488386 RepID=UPI001911ACE7|nr:ABC transporter ATP-binding protein [Streptomyces sp. MBT55]MBK6043330.1 ABC transporter ATP-binding protein [Streptomyces sp. MBT55]
MTSPQRLVWDATARTRGWFVLASATAVLGSAGTLAFPWAMARALDAVVARRPATGPVLVCAALLALVVTTGALQTLANGGYGSGTVAALRRSLVRRTLDAGVPGTAGFPAGDLAGRLSAGCAQAGSAGVTLVTASAAVLTSLGGVVALWLIDWRIGLCFSLGVPPLVLIARVFMNRGSGLFLRYQETQGRISALLLEALGGARTIGASGTAAAETRRVLEPLPELSRTGHRVWALQRDTGWQVGLLIPAVEVLVLCAGGLALLHGDISAGELAAVVGYTALAMAALDQLDALFALGMSAAGARRVAEVVDQPVPAPGTRARPASGPGTLTLSGVTVRSGTRLVLDSVDLVVPAGTALAVVGRSGAGKSTLGALIGRLREPDAGLVAIDGVPLPELTPRALRAAVGYAFERPALLGTTVAGTIAFARPDASREEVAAAAGAARADDFIARLPHGYDTPLKDAPLSGGEVQRLGIARALVHDPAVVVLDDALSSLDTATEARVGSALASAWSARTRVLIAHRVSTAARADLVAWLENGKVRALGPHQELWRLDGYRALFAADTGTVPETAPEAVPEHDPHPHPQESV